MSYHFSAIPHFQELFDCPTYTGFWWGNLRERDHLGDPVVDGRIILKWIFKKWDGSMDWTDVAQNIRRWQAVVNAVMNLQVS